VIKLFGPSQILRKDETLDVYREGPTTYADGKPVKHAQIRFQVVANVQPVNGRDLLLVPEHDRFKEQLWLYLDNKQFVVDEGLEVQGPSRLKVNDRVARLSENYQVQSVENWGTYSRARAMRIDVGPERTP
jgi:hypothetical protein